MNRARSVLVLVCAVGASSAFAVPVVEVAATFADLNGPLFSYQPPPPMRYVRGELQLSFELVRGEHNPLCFAYSVDPEVTDWTPPPPIALNRAPKAALARETAAEIDARLTKRINECAPALNRLWAKCSTAPEKAFAAQAMILQGELGSCSQSDQTQTELWLASEAAGADKTNIEGLAASVKAVEESVELARRLSQASFKFSVRYPTGKAITLKVTRQARARGLLDTTVAKDVFVGQSFKTLAPIRLDVGVGPGITFTPKADYEYVARATETGSEWFVARTANDLNLDGIVMFSPYYFARWLDETSFDPTFLIPRFAVGLSITQAFSSVYLGLQIDPYQFVDLTFGYRLFSQTVLIGRAEGDLALLDADGAPLALGKGKTLGGSFFFAITTSTDLFVRWISSF